MSHTAARLVDQVIPHVTVRQWVLPLPIALRLLLASLPERVAPVLQVVLRVLSHPLLDRAGPNAAADATTWRPSTPLLTGPGGNLGLARVV